MHSTQSGILFYHNDYVMRPRSYSRRLRNTNIYVNVNVNAVRLSICVQYRIVSKRMHISSYFFDVW